MADNYKITQYSVNSILGYISTSQIAIPEIQRPFVWKGKEVRDLIDSLYEGYPIGYLIIWQNSQVRVRGFGKGGTKKILIDGQQRVTALMTALLGREVLDDQYRSHTIKIAFNPLAEPGEERFQVSDDSYAERPGWIPDISVFFRKDFAFRKFEKDFKAKNAGLDLSGLEEAVDRLRGIVKHQVGVIELSFLLDIDVVSEIFIRINLQGKPLNQEDFAMSKISVNEQYDGDRIRNSIDYFCHLLREPSFLPILNEQEKDFMQSEYGQALAWAGDGGDYIYTPSYADTLKILLIACFGKSRMGDLVNMLSGKISGKGQVSEKLARESFEKLAAGVKAFVSEKNFKGFLGALERAGYCCGRLVYSQALLNYCYAMYLLMDMEGVGESKKASLIGRWMTMSLVTGHYQNSPDTVLVRDYNEIKSVGFESYLRQIEELRLTDEFYGEALPDKFKAATVRTAPFIAYMAAQCASGSSALYSVNVPLKDIYREGADAYQILPKAYLEKCGFKTRETYGQAGNITYVDKEIRGLVKRKPPAEYKEALLARMTQEQVRDSLREHGIPENIFEADPQHIEEILAGRRQAMAAKIKDAYGAL